MLVGYNLGVWQRWWGGLEGRRVGGPESLD